MAHQTPADFRRAVLIDTDNGPRLMAEVVEEFQERDFAELDKSWMRAIHRVGDGPLMAYLERPKGHSKTTDMATMVAWALYACPRRIKGVAGAADKDQAGLLKEAIEKLCDLNPWLKAVLKVQAWHIVNLRTGSQLDILSADEASSHGELPDFVIVDELTHHKKPGLWESLFAGAAKRANCLLVVMSNAGLGKGRSWQWKVREAFRELTACYFSRLEGPTASWITPERLATQRRILPPKAFNRLWLNIWQTEAGDALDPADIEACCVLEGPQAHPEDGWFYAGCLDLGLTHDHAGFVVLACKPGRIAFGADDSLPLLDPARVRIASVQAWKPTGPGGQVPLGAVELEVLKAHQRFGLNGVWFDRWEAAYMAQRLGPVGVHMIPVVLSAPKEQTWIANTLLGAFSQRSLELYRDEKLLADLAKLSIVEKPYGYKLEAVRDEEGHADTAVALAIGLPRAFEWCRELAMGMHTEE